MRTRYTTPHNPFPPHHNITITLTRYDVEPLSLRLVVFRDEGGETDLFVAAHVGVIIAISGREGKGKVIVISEWRT